MLVIVTETTDLYSPLNLLDGDKKNMARMKKNFKVYFEPKSNVSYERFLFFKIVQKDEETSDEFLTRIKIHTNTCRSVASSPVKWDGNSWGEDTLRRYVDSNSRNLGMSLLQGGQLVAYCARTLTKSEQNHTQLEKKAFAIRFWYKKFHEYV